MKTSKLLRLAPKITAGTLLALVFLDAWRNGSFKGWGRDKRKLEGRFYLRFFIGLLLLMGLFLPLDSALLVLVQSWGERLPGLVNFGSFIGGNVNYWVLVTGAYFFFRLLGWKKGTQICLGMLLASLASALVCQGLKIIFLRARPFTGLPPFSFFHWGGILKDDRAFQSFPSGDTVLVSGGFGYFFHSSPNRRLRWLGFLLPLSTAFARVSLDRHWVSDTIASLMIGLMVSRWIWDHFHEDSAPLHSG